MSRTYRNIQHTAYFTKPQTHNYRKGLLYSKQEIKEELGNKYLIGNNESHKKIASSWDDKNIAARSEVLAWNEYMERIYLNKFELNYWYLKLNFNSHKNRYEIGKHFNYLVKNYYAPFCINYKKVKYPVVIYEHNWWVT